MGIFDNIKKYFTKPKPKQEGTIYLKPSEKEAAPALSTKTGATISVPATQETYDPATKTFTSGGGGGGYSPSAPAISAPVLIPTQETVTIPALTAKAPATVSRLAPSPTKYKTEMVSQEEYDERTRLGLYKGRAEIDLPPVTFGEKDILRQKTKTKFKSEISTFRKIGDIPFFETDLRTATKKIISPMGKPVRREGGASIYLDVETGKEFKLYTGYAPPIIPAGTFNPQTLKTTYAAVSTKVKGAKVYTETLFKTSKGQVGYSQTVSKLFGKGKDVKVSAGITKGFVGTKNIKLPSGKIKLTDIKVFRAGQGTKTVSGKGDILTGSISKFKGTAGSMSIKQLFGKGTQIDDFAGVSARIGTSKVGAAKGVAFTEKGFNIFKGTDFVIKAPTTSAFTSAGSSAAKSNVLKNIIKQNQALAQAQTSAGVSTTLSKTSTFLPSLAVSAPTIAGQSFKAVTPTVTKTITFPKVATTTIATTKTKQVPLAATFTGSTTRTKTRGTTTTFTSPIITTATIPRLTTTPIQTTTPVLKTPTITKITPRTTTPVVPYVPIVPTPIIPKPFAFALPSAFLGKGTPAGFLSGGFGSRYTPSFKALAFDIKGAKPKVKRYTGLELRPITPDFSWLKPKKLKRRKRR